MKTTNQNQNSTTSPRSKRRGLIHLALLCLLSVFMAPIQSFAQQVPTVMSSASRIPTRWWAIQANPITVKNGGSVTLTGQLQFAKIPNDWRGLPSRTCTLEVGNLPIEVVKTDAKGVVKITIKFFDPQVAAGLFPRGKIVRFRFRYGGDSAYVQSYRDGAFTVIK